MAEQQILNCSCCGRERSRNQLHRLGDSDAFICRRCALWVALRWRSDSTEEEGR